MDTADRLKALLEKKLKEKNIASELKNLETLQSELKKLGYALENNEYTIPPIDTIGINLEADTSFNSPNQSS